MRPKLKLELEELAVESFDTRNAAEGADGTVQAHSATFDPYFCQSPGCESEPEASCQISYCGMCVTVWEPTCQGGPTECNCA